MFAIPSLRRRTIPSLNADSGHFPDLVTLSGSAQIASSVKQFWGGVLAGTPSLAISRSYRRMVHGSFTG